MKRSLLPALSLLVLAVGCHQDMWQQPKSLAQSRSDFFLQDRSGSRPQVMGTVAFGEPRLDTEYETGYSRDGRLVRLFPVKVDERLLKRGRERYDIFCSHCHGKTGDGQGMIAKRGFTLARPVATYHTDRLREMPVGHFFDVVTNGYGAMYPFKGRVKTEDRWAIAAYIRVLQRARHAPLGSVPTEERAKLEALPYDPGQDALPEAPPVPRVVPLGRPGSPAGTSAPRPEPVETGTAEPVPGGRP
jgi:mono/diheme cytochrome c family protein